MYTIQRHTCGLGSDMAIVSIIIVSSHRGHGHNRADMARALRSTECTCIGCRWNSFWKRWILRLGPWLMLNTTKEDYLLFPYRCALTVFCVLSCRVSAAPAPSPSPKACSLCPPWMETYTPSARNQALSNGRWKRVRKKRRVLSNSLAPLFVSLSICRCCLSYTCERKCHCCSTRITIETPLVCESEDQLCVSSFVEWWKPDSEQKHYFEN